MRKSIRKAISIMLAAAFMLPGAGKIRAAGIVTQSDENEDFFVQSYEEEADNARFDDQGDDLLSPTGTFDVSKIKKPRTSDGVSTWDCIWFGNYWQEDTNGDGKCYSKDYTSGDTTYKADSKQPIKWRVLDIDSNGDALLLADKLIDIVQYNEEFTDVTWETCTLRSYLNGYDGSNNVCNKDFSGDKSFIHNAFSEAERDSIIISDLKNPDNPVFEIKGGDNTQDKIFCLSLDEVRTAGYGFIKNEFTNGGEKPYYTDSDPTRVAVTTKFTEDKPGYYGNTAGKSDWWWLRSPGKDSRYASDVGNGGAAYASSHNVGSYNSCARPAFRMNLSSSSSLWTYAGTVSSDGTVNTAVDNVKRPQTTDSGVSTWDCIWFGNYWQEDTNGDGYCYAEETGGHAADAKQPVKWRVLDIDDNGNALLLADKLIDIVQYNEINTSVTWKTCTMRSYLNGYDGSNNDCKKDFSGDKSFIYNAFSEAERDSIIISDLKNPDNPVFETKGGDNTQDKIFCLSLDEARTAGYGFIKNEFTNPGGADIKYYTDDDPTRVAVTTKFTDDKPEYNGNTAGESDWWWLRSPGNSSSYAAYVSNLGAVIASYSGVSSNLECVRPAFRMNLSSSSSLWTYAGTVSSDGTVVEPVGVTGVSLVETAEVAVGGNLTLTPEISPSNATDKTVTWKSSDEGVATVSTEGVVTGVAEGTAGITVTTKDGGYTATCAVTVKPSSPGPALNIKKPRTSDGVSTWDCVWFGNYWQGDTNGDGYCYAEDTNGHPADSRQPVKWRVLDIDSGGNALLLADKLIDIVQYNETETDLTWENCTMRSYLNGYGSSQNVCSKDFTGDKSFLYSAFSETERDKIKNSNLPNPKNPVYETEGGNDTQDKIFCLSLDEVRTAGYGFIKNEFTNGGEKPYYTDSDPTRVAVTTKFTDDKPDYSAYSAGESDWWWLRSPGENSKSASYVRSYGEVYADGDKVDGCSCCVRPAFRMNLSSSSLWKYAGTVGSDGTVVEFVAVTGISLQETAGVYVGKTLTLTPEISPSNATNRTVTWKSSAEGVATVSTEGVVTGITEGTADITVTTNDGGYTATCKVTVTKEGPEPGPDPSEEDLKKDIDVDTADLNFDMLPGEVRRLKINKTGKYVYGVSYVSDDPKTVSVKSGVVTAKKLKKDETEKKVTVTATYNGESVPFVITVKASLPAISEVQKGNKITAPKTVKAGVGTSKTVTATVKLPKALQGKEVRAKVVLPEDLPGTSVADGATENAFFDLGEGKPDAKGTKVSFVITPKEAGAAYVVWTVTDDGGNRSQAYTKVLIKKPLSTFSVNCPETGLDLSLGEGERLIVTTTKGNTDSKDLSFSVKGKGVKVSKSGFVTAVTPGAEADVTVKAGKVNKKVTVRVKDHPGSILALNKTSVNVKRPKEGAKPKTAALKVTMPKKDPPEVKWSITDSPKGIAVDQDGKVTVTSDASPGCYTVTAAPKDTGSGYNPVCCELIVR